MRAGRLRRYLGLSKGTWVGHVQPRLTAYRIASFLVYSVAEAEAVVTANKVPNGGGA
jgi:hypothetical protein